MHVRSRRVRMERHEIIVIIADHALGGFAHGLLHSFRVRACRHRKHHRDRSEEHTSELQSLMRISYAVFCLKKKNKISTTNNHTHATSCKNSIAKQDTIQI